MIANRVYEDVINGVEEIEVNGHEIQFGGSGDGYCYTHQDFACLDNLTDEERDALNHA